MSEDEDNQPSTSSRHTAPQQQQPQRSGPVLTQDYLASVLASIRSQPLAAQPSQPVQQSAPVPVAPTPQNAPTSSGITRDYFQNVMQQIFTPPAAAPAQPSQQSTLSGTQSRPAEPTPARSNISDAEIAAKLEQMHELGLFDDELNLRALQITEGNVDAAVSIIMEGGL